MLRRSGARFSILPGTTILCGPPRNNDCIPMAGFGCSSDHVGSTHLVPYDADKSVRRSSSTGRTIQAGFSDWRQSQVGGFISQFREPLVNRCVNDDISLYVTSEVAEKVELPLAVELQVGRRANAETANQAVAPRRPVRFHLEARPRTFAEESYHPSRILRVRRRSGRAAAGSFRLLNGIASTEPTCVPRFERASRKQTRVAVAPRSQNERLDHHRSKLTRHLNHETRPRRSRVHQEWSA